MGDGRHTHQRSATTRRTGRHDDGIGSYASDEPDDPPSDYDDERHSSVRRWTSEVGRTMSKQPSSQPRYQHSARTTTRSSQRATTAAGPSGNPSRYSETPRGASRQSTDRVERVTSTRAQSRGRRGGRQLDITDLDESDNLTRQGYRLTDQYVKVNPRGGHRQQVTVWEKDSPVVSFDERGREYTETVKRTKLQFRNMTPEPAREKRGKRRKDEASCVVQ